MLYLTIIARAAFCNKNSVGWGVESGEKARERGLRKRLTTNFSKYTNDGNVVFKPQRKLRKRRIGFNANYTDFKQISQIIFVAPAASTLGEVG